MKRGKITDKVVNTLIWIGILSITFIAITFIINHIFD
tara:strand:+ start:3170 stop:3280 length:111 start_codon:yes stop_codon:yes gene_type:complete